MPLRAEEEQDEATARWELAIATVQALAAVLPDVPVPLLANRTPRELYQAGSEERAAALEYLRSVACTAEAVGVDFLEELQIKRLASPPPARLSQEERQQIVLASFTLQMFARGFEPNAVLGAQLLLRDLVRVVRPTFRKPAAYAAAIDYAMCWMHFRPEGRKEIAALYRVSPSTIGRHFATMKRELKLVWYDPRYAVQESTWQEMLEETARALADGEDEPPTRAR